MADHNNSVQAEKPLVDKQKVDMYIMSNQNFFPAEKISFLKKKLYALDEEQFFLLSSVDLKNPTTLLIVSILLGWLGIDRFMLKDTGMGVLKLLTAGCCGILALIDWFTIQGKAREMNFNNVMFML